MQLVPEAQQSRVWPHPSLCPQPALPKSAQVLGMHATHTLPSQLWPVGQGLHDCSTPQPRSTGAQPLTPPSAAACAQVIGVQHALLRQISPAAHGLQTFWTPQPTSTAAHPVPASTSAQVPGVQQALVRQMSPAAHGLHTFWTPHPTSTGLHPLPASTSEQVPGVQQAPLTHCAPLPQVPQFTATPQPLLIEPQLMAPHVGGVHPVHVPLSHLLSPVQPAQVTWPLPQALVMVPHLEPVPPSLPVHSGGGAVHTPPVQSCPMGHVHDCVCPQPSLTVPHRFTPAAGEHVSLPQLPLPPASLGGGCVMQALFTHVSPAGHPPQLTATPHESTAISPHLPVQDGFWQLCDEPLVMHDSPVAQGMPHVRVCPSQSM